MSWGHVYGATENPSQNCLHCLHYAFDKCMAIWLVATNLGQMAMLVTTNQAKLVTTNIPKLVCTNLSNLYVSGH
jgi:hypothetical protein